MRLLLISVFAVFFVASAHAQTSLQPGDLFITGINTDTEEFTFVSFVNLTAGTQIYFTDEEPDGDYTISAGEGTVLYTAPAGGVSAGTVISYTANSSDFTITSDGNINLSNSGDNILAYQGSSLGVVTTFLFSIAKNAAGIGTYPVAFNSYLITSSDNADYTGSRSGDRYWLEYQLQQTANYTTSSTTIGALNTTAFTTTNCTAPTIAPSNLASSAVTSSSATVTFTAGNGDSTIAVLSMGGRPYIPVNTLDYTASSAYTSGSLLGGSNYVVFKGGPTTSFSISNLQPSTAYTVYLYTYSNSGTTCYNRVADSLAFITDCSVPLAATTVSDSIFDVTVYTTWENPLCYDEVLVVAKQGSAPTYLPSGGGSAYTANSTFGLGTEVATGEYVVYKGVADSTVLNGFTYGETYYKSVFVRKGTNWSAALTNSFQPVLRGFQINAEQQLFTINFNATQADVGVNAFQGNGFAPVPQSGELNSNTFQITGMSDGDLLFSQTNKTGDFARGSGTAGKTTGGIYGFEITPNNYALGVQASSSDFTPGSITLKLANTSGVTIQTLDFGYSLYTYNDQSKALATTVEYSLDNSNFTPITSFADTTTANLSLQPYWEQSIYKTTLTSLGWTTNSNLYIRFTLNEAGGSGSIDEWALDDVNFLANAATKIWNGTSWSPSAPNSNDHAEIQGNLTLNNQTLEVNNLTISAGDTVSLTNGSSLKAYGSTQNNGYLWQDESSNFIQGENSNFIAGSGTFGIRKIGHDSGNIPYKFNYVGSPYEATVINGVGITQYEYNVDTALFYDDSRYGWELFSGIMQPGNGYAVTNADTFVFESQTPNNGTIEVTGRCTTLTDGSKVFNLVSNPYISGLDALAFVEQNTFLSGTLYFWTDNGTGTSTYSSADYATWTAAGSTSANGMPAPGNEVGTCQGFFVQADASSSASNQSIVFNNSMRVNGGSVVYKTPDFPAVWLSVRLNQTEAYSQTLLTWHPNATDSLDRMYDAIKLESGNISVHSRWEQHKMAVQSFLNDTNAQERMVPIEIQATHAGAYTLFADSIKALAKFNTYLDMNGNRIPFNAGDSITIQLMANEVFTINFVVSSSLGGPNNTSTAQVYEPFKVIKTAEYCEVKNQCDHAILIKEYNLLGALIRTTSIAGGESFYRTKSSNQLAIYVVEEKGHTTSFLH